MPEALRGATRAAASWRHYVADDGALQPAQFLRHTAVPGEGSIHIIGSFERRVTLWSGQHHALNLVDTMHHEGMLGADKRVAVGGGGVAELIACDAPTEIPTLRSRLSFYLRNASPSESTGDLGYRLNIDRTEIWCSDDAQ